MNKIYVDIHVTYKICVNRLLNVIGKASGKL